MNRRFSLSLLVATAMPLFYAGTVAIAAQHEHGGQHEKVLKVGKTGEVTFDKETKVGEVTLAPGRYKFQHRVEGSEHFVHFTEWTKPHNIGSTGAPKAHPGEIKCRIEPLGKKVSRTAVYTRSEGSLNHVTKVQVGGENVEHIF